MTARPSPNAAPSPLFAGTFYTSEIARAHREALDALQGMSAEEAFATLVAANIYAPDGTLRAPYADTEADDVAPDASEPAQHTRR